MANEKYYYVIISCDNKEKKKESDLEKAIHNFNNDKDNDNCKVINFNSKYRKKSHPFIEDKKLGFEIMIRKEEAELKSEESVETMLKNKELTETIEEIINKIMGKLKIKKNESKIIFDNPWGPFGERYGDSLHLLEQIDGLSDNEACFLDSNMLRVKLETIIGSSTFKIDGEYENETLKLIYEICSKYSTLEPESKQINEKIYEKIFPQYQNNVEDFDMCSSFTLGLKNILEKKYNEKNVNSFEKMHKYLQKVDFKKESSVNIAELLTNKVFLEASTLYYSIGNFIPMLGKGFTKEAKPQSGNQKKGIGHYFDIFDLYIRDFSQREELLWYIENENLFMMPMEYYTVIKDKKFLDNIITNSQSIHGEEDRGLEGILELYNFFNLRIKLRGSKIIYRLVHNDSDMNLDNKEKIKKELNKIEEDYDKRLRTSIKKLNVYMKDPSTPNV